MLQPICVESFRPGGLDQNAVCCNLQAPSFEMRTHVPFFAVSHRATPGKAAEQMKVELRIKKCEFQICGPKD